MKPQPSTSHHLLALAILIVSFGAPNTLAVDRHHASADWCDRIVGGRPGTRDFRVDLSAAHALTRAFSMAAPFAASDAALVAAMRAGPLKLQAVSKILATYASELDDVCAADARTEDLGPATVQRIGPIAIVKPGVGQPSISPATSLVVIDLRDLPAVPALDAALARAVAPALATPLTLPARWVRGHDGPADEFIIRGSVYSTFVTIVEPPPIAPAGNRDVPLVLLTSRRMAPASAAFAGALRMARRAFIVGDDVFASVAE